MTRSARCFVANAAALVAVATAILLGTMSTTLWHTEPARPVQIIHRMWLEETELPVGGQLRVHYIVTRTEECNALIYRFIINSETQAVEWSSIAPPYINRAGPDQVGFTVLPLPPFLAPGEYDYRAVTINSGCRGNRTSVTPSPDQHFRIAPP